MFLDDLVVLEPFKNEEADDRQSRQNCKDTCPKVSTANGRLTDDERIADFIVFGKHNIIMPGAHVEIAVFSGGVSKLGKVGFFCLIKSFFCHNFLIIGDMGSL